MSVLSNIKPKIYVISAAYLNNVLTLNYSAGYNDATLCVHLTFKHLPSPPIKIWSRLKPDFALQHFNVGLKAIPKKKKK